MTTPTLHLHPDMNMRAIMDPPEGHEWIDLTLREVIQQALPDEAANHYTQKLYFRITTQLGTKKESLSALISERHVVRYKPEGERAYSYLLTEHAATIITQEARRVAETIYERQPLTPPLFTVTLPQNTRKERATSLQKAIRAGLPKGAPPPFLTFMEVTIEAALRRREVPYVHLLNNRDIIETRASGYILFEHAASLISEATELHHRLTFGSPSHELALDRPNPEEQSLADIPLAKTTLLLQPGGEAQDVIAAGRISQAIRNQYEPFATLMNNGHLKRIRTKDKRYAYLMSYYGAITIAAETINIGKQLGTFGINAITTFNN